MNAKELILKKINADTNWVDIYTVSFMLGENLTDVGELMLDRDITKLINNYSSSIFSDVKNTDKIKYINDVINSTKDPEKIKKYQQLLTKAIAADEVRILGKILKINQGLPTNTADTYNYIKSIEKYVESRFNSQNINAVKEIQRDLEIAKNEKVNEKTIFSLLSSLKKAKAIMVNDWSSFDLIKFILDDNYKQNMINQYEANKINFNILEVIAQVPHFKEMFNILALNKQILNSLSIRNRLEDIIWNQVEHRSKKEDGTRSTTTNITVKLDKEEILELKDKIDEHLINSWIISKNLSVTIPADEKNNPAPKTINLNNNQNILEFVNYVETYAIPLLKEKLPNNKFISLLTFGLKNRTPFYKLPFNMVQVDNTQKTRSLYEEALYAFNNLNNIKVDGIDMNIVDMFYLYNLIINKDKFGPSTLTRIFEDLISAAGNEKLLVYDFNNWIDKQDIKKLVETFNYAPVNMVESTPVIEDAIEITDEDTDTSEIGFVSKPTETDVEEATVENPINSFENKKSDLVGNYYDTKPSVESKLIALVKAANIKGLHLVYDADLVSEEPSIRNAKGFVKNGEIYINADRANDDTVIHEFGHLYLADAKLQHPEEYYQILAKVRETTLWKDMRNMIEYSNKRGSDFDEEVLATMISNYYKENDKSITIEENSKLNDESIVKETPYTPKGKNEQLYTIEFDGVDYHIYNKTGNEVFKKGVDGKKDSKDRIKILTNYKIQNKQAVVVSYENKDYVVDNEHNIISVSSGEIMNWSEDDANRKNINQLADAKFKTKFNVSLQQNNIVDNEETINTVDLEPQQKILIEEVLNMVDPKYKEFLNSDIIPILSDVFIDNYKEQQKLATIKNKLIKDNIIKEDCK